MSDLEKRSKEGPEPEPAPESTPESVTLRRPAVSAPEDEGEMTDTMPSPAPGGLGEAELPARGRTLAGRYTVLDLIGQGGMGVVLAAYDSRLDRRVALKLLRAHADSSAAGAAEKRRLLREAQAMARLNHPHVVAVYDSGEIEDGSVFLAMEYVKGQTLRQWRRAQTRSWREVLQAYVQAGRGLAAAHTAGLIHRDFKPDNVLMGRAGEVKVTDFGLARAEGAEDSMSMSGIPIQRLLDKLDSPLTLPGTVMGTPAYMAPELLEGRQADARSDLYAFCVSLYEALYGQLPFPTGSMSELTQAQAQGRVTPPPAHSEVPAGVARTVLRGLQADRLKRPANMAELLTALEVELKAGRKARVWAVALAGALLVLGGIAAWAWVQQQPRCSSLGERLTGVWEATVKERVTRALTDTGVPYAASTAARVAQGLDDYAARWRELSTQVCEATRGQRGLSREVLAFQEYCLERRRSQLGALTELLAQGPDKQVVPGAVQAVQTLPPLEDCMKTKAPVAAPLPEDPAVRAQVESLLPRVDRLEALFRTGKYQEGLALGHQVLGEVKPVGFAPLHAQALYTVAWLHWGAGDPAGAEVRVRESIKLAAQGKDSALQANAWGLLVRVVREHRSPQEALGLELALEAAVGEAGDEAVRARSLHELGNVYAALGRHEKALEYHEHALALLERRLGSNHPQVAAVLGDLGNTLQALGLYDKALAQQGRVRAMLEQSLGPEHPSLAEPLEALGALYLSRSQPALAVPLLESALAIAQHDKASVQLSLARALWDSGGDRPRAVELATQAREHWQRLGHPRLAEASQWLASHPLERAPSPRAP